jgi:hypothetical protein
MSRSVTTKWVWPSDGDTGAQASAADLAAMPQRYVPTTIWTGVFGSGFAPLGVFGMTVNSHVSTLKAGEDQHPGWF